MAALPEKPACIGRFQVLRPLGRGAQGAVWLAHDPQLKREVAIKTLNSQGNSDPKAVSALLAEAVMVSRLTHPNIVPLYDAGQEGRAAWLVFEYAEGRTLSARLRESGPLPPGAAVPLVRHLLRALEFAHGKGIVHRDIKPGNVMVADDGTARVMDFGIAGWLSAGEAPAAGGFRGTPAYMAPEAIDGTPSDARGDVFAAGMVLYEMLAGRTAAEGTTVFETLHRIANLPFDPPSKASPGVDGRLDAIVMRALAKHPAQRFASAAEFGAALDGWLQTAEAPAGGSEGQATVEFLLRRIRTRSDFPALSDTISAVNRAARSDTEGVGSLSGSILKDFALTNKLLRLVNTVCYGQFGGSISTVSRAIMVMGFDQVRSVAVTLMLFEHLQNRAQASDLKDEVLSAYFGGLLARELADHAGVRNREESFIGAMFHNLGKLLTAFYFHDEYQEIRKQLARGETEASAARLVLGTSFEDLGVAVARTWNFPEKLIDGMRAVPEGRLRGPGGDEDRLRALAAMSAELCGVIRDVPAEKQSEHVDAIAERYEALGVAEGHLRGAVESAVREITADAGILSSRTATSPFLGKARRLVAELSKDAVTLTFDDPVAASTLAEPGPVAPPAARQAGMSVGERRAVLSAGIQDITEALMGQFQLNDVLRIILETMYRGAGFTRVLLCVRDPSSNALKARIGFGRDADRIVNEGFCVPLSGTSDLFQAALAKAADICIEDTDGEKIRDHVPQWYRERVGARTLALFPVVINRRPVALFYGDADEAGAISFSTDELALLKTLRNQAVLAIRTQGG